MIEKRGVVHKISAGFQSRGCSTPEGTHEITYIEAFAKLHKTSNSVIPAKAGIQYYQVFPRFRVMPGMTISGVMQRSYIIYLVRDFSPADAAHLKVRTA